MTTNARDEKWSEWIDWSGGECPLSDEEFYQIKTRDGSVIPKNMLINVRWSHRSDDRDIIAYRYKIKEPESDMHLDLEWLARNVSEWPSEPKKNSHGIGWNGINNGREPDFIRRVDPLSSEYTRAQWQAARQQLGLDNGGWTPEAIKAAAFSTPEEEEAWQAKERQLIGGPRKAENFLHQAAELMAERGKQYDQPGGERSMGKAVAALNAITGRGLTEAEGWLLMSLVKRVRQHSGAGYHRDSAEDAVAYAALEGEALEASALRARELGE